MDGSFSPADLYAALIPVHALSRFPSVFPVRREIPIHLSRMIGSIANSSDVKLVFMWLVCDVSDCLGAIFALTDHAIHAALQWYRRVLVVC